MTTDTTMTDVDTPMTKQISRDDVEAVILGLPLHVKEPVAAMLRSLMDRVEKAEGHCMSVERQIAKVADLEIKLAAANERADEIEMRTMVFSNHLEIAGYTKFATDLRKAIAGGD